MNDSSRAGVADPKISLVLMIITYVVGGVGYVIGFAVNGSVESTKWVCLLSVGVVGVVSMIRHAIFNRSDARRMGWDLGRRNNFQLETGFANGAIGVVALLAVLGSWGVVAQAGLILVYALYFVQVTVLVVMDRSKGFDRGRFLAMVSQTLLLGWFAVAGLHHAGASPFG